jgi:large subunit ribosomal protein L7/L12
MASTKLTVEQFIEAVKEMSLIEMNELVKALEEEFGVSAAAMAVAGAGAGAGAGAASEEKLDFDVVLKSGGDKKIQVIKVVRELTSLGLKEAKDLVDAGGKILEAVPKAKAEEAKKALEEAGAVVELS